MPEKRNLLTEEDLSVIQEAFSKALEGYKCEVTCNYRPDSCECEFVITTDVPHEEIIRLNVEVINPMIKEIEKELDSEAEWEWYGLCKCGASAEVWVNDNYPEDDPCICDKCNRKKIKEIKGSELYTCLFCKKKFDPKKLSETEYHANLEANVFNEYDLPTVDYYMREEEREMYIERVLRARSKIYEKGKKNYVFDVLGDYLCSLKCTKKYFAEWFKRVANHPFTKECLAETGD